MMFRWLDLRSAHCRCPVVCRCRCRIHPSRLTVPTSFKFKSIPLPPTEALTSRTPGEVGDSGVATYFVFRQLHGYYGVHGI